MIQWPIDEARGFDELSIATLKVLASASAIDGYGAAVEALVSQLGAKKVDEVMASSEYLHLVALNRQNFEAINRLAEEGEWAGGFTEMNGPKGWNHQRWLAKAALQARFFPKSPLTERKVGYREDNL